MNIELPGGFRHVQAVLKELVDGRQGLFIELIRRLAVENLPDEHPAQRHGQLIDQAADTEAAVGHHVLFAVEDLSHVQGHLGFLVGTGDILDFAHHGAEGHICLCSGLRAQHIHDGLRHALQVVAVFLRPHFPHQNDILLIHCRDEILGLCGEKAPDRLQCVHVPLLVRFNDKYNPAHVGLDMELLRPVVNVHQKEVVQQEILDEIIPVEPLLVGDQEVLELEHRHLADHVDIVPLALYEEDVFQLLLVKNLEKLISLYDLAVRLRIHKRQDGLLILLRPGKGGRQGFSLRIADAEVHPADFL